MKALFGMVVEGEFGGVSREGSGALPWLGCDPVMFVCLCALLVCQPWRASLGGGGAGVLSELDFSAQNQLDTQHPLVTESVKRAVVSTARDSWQVYFSRLFPATVRSPCPPLTAPKHAGTKPHTPHRLLPSTAGQCGHRRADPRCVPHGHQAAAHGQGQPGGQRTAAGPACIQVAGSCMSTQAPGIGHALCHAI